MAAEARRKALVFLLIVLGTTILIGTGLPRLDFQPAMPLPKLENGQVIASPSEITPLVGISVSSLFTILLIILLVVMVGLLIYRLIKRVNWKQFLSDFFRYIFIILVISGIFALVMSALPKSQGTSYSELPPPPAPEVRAPLGPVPSSVIWLVGILLASLIVAVSIWIIRSKPKATRELWEWEAEQARQALLAGQDLKNVILSCYRRMSQALQEGQHLERDASMTTGEFERLLVSQGVPRGPVHQLTQLFEAARYGHWQPGPEEEESALRCLEAILAYSRNSLLEG